MATTKAFLVCLLILCLFCCTARISLLSDCVHSIFTENLLQTCQIVLKCLKTCHNK